MVSGRAPNKKRIEIVKELVPAHRCWVALQARQLQRLGLEALLVWIEQRITEVGGTADALSLSVEANRLVCVNAPFSHTTNVRVQQLWILENLMDGRQRLEWVARPTSFTCSKMVITNSYLVFA